MKKPRKPPRTQRQKLEDALGTARAKLSATAPRGMYPTAGHETAWHEFSGALCRLVAYRLAAPQWEMDEDEHPWGWDPYDKVFSFSYVGVAELTRTTEERERLAAPRMWCRINLQIDPEQPLEAEIARLRAEAAHARESAALMERELLRAAVRRKVAIETPNPNTQE